MQKFGLIVVATAFAAVPAFAAPGPSPAAVAAYAKLHGDAAAGAKVFTQCKTCHVTTPGVNRIGPSLHAVVGRKAGIEPKYVYSTANKTSGITWTEAKLFEYLEAPRTIVPGTKMSFAGLKNPQDRANVIAYLKTQ
ncbi:cytochrome c family protein [Sphingosinicellaceae bacterium]|nr:cytochrome c family protein [Sphingosinicellaceae bacterium]